jgi:hypothetical protein
MSPVTAEGAPVDSVRSGSQAGSFVSAREWAARSRELQGLPPRIKDPTVLTCIAELLIKGRGTDLHSPRMSASGGDNDGIALR